MAWDILGLKPSRFRVVSGTAFADVPMSYVQSFDLDPNITELTFEGEGTSHTHNVSSEISGTMTFGQFNSDWLDFVVGATAVTGAGLPTGVAKMWHPELGTYPNVQAEIDMRVKDMGAAGVEKTIRLYVWAMQLQNPLAISGVGNLEAVTQEYAWTSLAVDEDLLGTAIAGVTPPETVHYSIAELS